MKIIFIFTCFNRKEKTENCIKSILASSYRHEITFVVADDGSNDGTVEMLNKMKVEQDIDILLITTGGNKYYSGSMSMAMDSLLENQGFVNDTDYVCLVNDDVCFKEGFLDKLISQSMNSDDSVVAGTTCDDQGNLSYGAIKYISGYKYRKLSIEESDVEADTFNANCVLIPTQVFKTVGTIDKHYVHSLGDFDYGLSIKRNGYKIYGSTEYIGVCNNNSNANTWCDSSLSVRQRLHLKESPKGAPFSQWFYFLNKNFGLLYAIKGSLTPYIRIFLKK